MFKLPMFDIYFPLIQISKVHYTFKLTIFTINLPIDLDIKSTFYIQVAVFNILFRLISMLKVHYIFKLTIFSNLIPFDLDIKSASYIEVKYIYHSFPLDVDVKRGLYVQDNYVYYYFSLIQISKLHYIQGTPIHHSISH